MARTFAWVRIGTCLAKANCMPDHVEAHSKIGAGIPMPNDLAPVIVRRNVEPQRINVSAAMTGLMPVLRSLAGGKVNLTAHVTDPILPVLIDASDLERIAFNLVANARDAMPTGGQVRISVTAMDAPALDAPTSDARWVLLEIEDDGVGMDEVTLSRALEPFYTTKPAGRGTGLGLASVLRAVRAASGELRIHSELENGTRVQVWLPLIP